MIAGIPCKVRLRVIGIMYKVRIQAFVITSIPWKIRLHTIGRTFS